MSGRGDGTRSGKRREANIGDAVGGIAHGAEHSSLAMIFQETLKAAYPYRMVQTGPKSHGGG